MMKLCQSIVPNYIAMLLLFVSINHAFAHKPPYCLPESPCWPTDKVWQDLNNKVHGRLHPVNSPLQICYKKHHVTLCQKVINTLHNPFYIESQAGLTQSTGWLNAWHTSPSLFAVHVKTSQDIANTLQFARQHHIKVVIKGTGHDYLGRSNNDKALLIWTHHMREVTLQPHFVPTGCQPAPSPVNAVTVEAGARWLEVYQKVSVQGDRYVQGGGCTSVGAVGGFTQGGGFGSWSKQFGTGAAGILEAELITADGKILTVNRCQHPDLFWALKGGGGGTFGVVSKMTLLTHPLPKTLGFLTGTLKAKNDDAFKVLLKRFLVFYRDKLSPNHWGEQAAIKSNNTIQLSMSFSHLSPASVNALWQPFIQSLSSDPKQFDVNIHPVFFPGKTFWNENYREKKFPHSIVKDSASDSKGFYWWRGNSSEVSIFLYYYLSRYLPYTSLMPDKLNTLVDRLYHASRLTDDLVLHFNKGQFDVPDEAKKRGEKTAMNPAVFQAVALIILANGEQYVFPNLPHHRPNLTKGKRLKEKAYQAMALIREVTPDAGSYANEADYFEPDWQATFWGKHYERLLRIKNRYDPTHFFSCHHCVGSESEEASLLGKPKHL